MYLLVIYDYVYASFSWHANKINTKAISSYLSREQSFQCQIPFASCQVPFISYIKKITQFENKAIYFLYSWRETHFVIKTYILFEPTDPNS